MLRNFQHSLAISPTSLHTIAVIIVAIWLMVGGTGVLDNDSQNSLWQLLPDGIRSAGWLNSTLAILTVVLTVYVLGELNISQVLLRLNSRAISFVFAALILGATSLHAFNIGMIVMFMLLLSYFTMFASYQMDDSAGLSYVTFLYLGISTLAMPQTIWLSPIYLLSMYILRVFNARSISGAILGLLTPWWIVGGLAFCTGHMKGLEHLLGQMVAFRFGNYALLTTCDLIVIYLSLLIFIVSTFDFYTRIYLDKTRTRCIFHLVVLHGFAYYLLLLLHPAGCRDILPAIIMNTSIMGGHYIGNDSTTLSNIVVCIITLLALAAFILNSWII